MRLHRRIAVTMVALCALIVGGSVQPASAAVWCNQAYHEVHQQSTFLQGTIYRFRHTLHMCSDQNPNYWTITQVTADYVTPYDIDGAWSYQGLVHDVQWNDMYLGLWINYWTQKGGHFHQDFWIYTDNLYPRVDLKGKSEGYIYWTYADEG